MEKNRVIEVLNKWNFWSKKLDTGIFRLIYLDKLLKFIQTDKVLSVVGVRRSGKSTLIRQVAKRLMKKVDREDILIVNFEEPEFEDADIHLLQKIYEAYLEIIKPKRKPYLFLDEIQNVDKWEKFIRSLNERKEAYFIISGSSSKILSEELATVLTGRQIYFEIFPLSFREFLYFEGIKIKEIKDMLLNSQNIKVLFRDYLEYGGFPEVVLNKDREFRIRTLRSYYEDILNRDVIQRYKIRKAEKMRTVARFYLTNISSPITFNRISKFIRLPVETIERYSSYLEISKLIFFIKRFSFSVKDQEKSPRKVYSIDGGLSNVMGFRFMENFGKLVENLVAIELKRRQSFNPSIEIYYWKDYSGKEVDFVVKEGLKVKQPIQVCWDISNVETKEREVKSLLKAMKEFKLKKGLIITEDYESEEDFKGRKIKFIPLWKWLLSDIQSVLR